MKSFACLIPLLAATSVAAHGYLAVLTIDNKSYKAPNPSGNNGVTASVIRKTNTAEPIKGAQNPALNCGPGAKPASLIADAQPGSRLTFQWKGDDESNWPHDFGPIMTYMADCGSVSCDKFDSTQAKWFKIGELGRTPGGWVQGDMHKGNPVSGAIPSTLKAGNYLLRHEVLGLHLADKPGGAEFYVGCAQLRVGGNQSGVPRPSDLVSLPGAYQDNQKSIFDPRIYEETTYQFPGPPVVSLTAGGNGSLANPPPPPPTPSSSDGKPKPTGSCRIKPKTSDGPNNNGSNAGYPRQISRVMRRVHPASHQSH